MDSGRGDESLFSDNGDVPATLQQPFVIADGADVMDIDQQPAQQVASVQLAGGQDHDRYSNLEHPASTLPHGAQAVNIHPVSGLQVSPLLSSSVEAALQRPASQHPQPSLSDQSLGAGTAISTGVSGAFAAMAKVGPQSPSPGTGLDWEDGPCRASAEPATSKAGTVGAAGVGPSTAGPAYAADSDAGGVSRERRELEMKDLDRDEGAGGVAAGSVSGIATATTDGAGTSGRGRADGGFGAPYTSSSTDAPADWRDVAYPTAAAGTAAAPGPSEAYWYDSDDVYDEPEHAYGPYTSHLDPYAYGYNADGYEYMEDGYTGPEEEFYGSEGPVDGLGAAPPTTAGNSGGPAAAPSLDRYPHDPQGPSSSYTQHATHRLQPQPQPQSHLQSQQQQQPRVGGGTRYRAVRLSGLSRSSAAAAAAAAGPSTSSAAAAGGGADGAGSSRGGRAGAGPSVGAAAGASGSAAGASGSGGTSSGGGFSCLRPPCPGPELVTADPWSEDEDEDADTTAEQFYSAAHPKDIQGIPWERLQFNRSTYRDTRLRQYRNYTNLLPDDDGGAYRAELAPLCAAPSRCGTAGAGGGAGSGAARGPPFFAFVRNSRAVQSNIVHFQLRNLVWASSPNDVFVVHDNCVNHWNPVARTVTEVLNMTGGTGGDARAAAAAGGGSSSVRVTALGRVQVSTLCVSGDLMAAGGFMGELVVKRLSGGCGDGGPGSGSGGFAGSSPSLNTAGAAAAGAAGPAARGGPGARFTAGVASPHAGMRSPAAAAGGGGGGLRRGGGGGGAGVATKAGSGMQGSLLYCGRITTSDNGITNGLEIYPDRTHGTVIMAANNDSQLRLFAAAAGEGALRPWARWPFDWAVNYATVRPGSHVAAVVGDDSATLLTDVHNGTTVARLEGHRDFSFAAAWHPGGVLLATGNQDTTALVWDVRRTAEPLTRLAGRMGAIRSVRFTPDGRFLAMSEPADFVHVYDVASGFSECQEHDFFGEIAGVAFTPDSSSLFVGVSDLTYASLMQLERQRCDPW